MVYRLLDLSDQDSVRNFATTILHEEPRIHFLINNAGKTMYKTVIKEILGMEAPCSRASII